MKTGLILVLCLSLACLSLSAQVDSIRHFRPDRRFDYDQIFSTNHWNLFLRPSITFAPHDYGRFDHYPVWFKIAPSPMVTFGWIYEITFRESWRRHSDRLSFDRPRPRLSLDRWAIQTGASIQLYWSNFNYSVPMSYTGLNQYFGAPQKIMTGTVLNIPIYGVYHQPLHDRNNSWLATFKMGVDINVANQSNTGVSYGDVGVANNGNNVTAFTNTQSDNFAGYYFAYISFHASAGVNYILPNKKMLNLQLVGNYSPFYKETNSYTFMPGSPQQVSGSSTRTLNYAGIELNYIFTRVKRMDKPAPGYSFMTHGERRLHDAHLYPYDGDTVPLRKRHYNLPTIFSTDHTNFVFRVNVLPFHIPFQDPVLRLYAKPDIGFMMGWMYQVNFKKRWGFQTGIQAEYNQESYFMNLPSATPTGRSQTLYYSNTAVAGFNIPLYACYSVPLGDKSDRWLANFKMGIDLKYGTDFNDASEKYGVGGNVSTWSNGGLTLATLTVSRPKGVMFYNSFNASAGINYVLPNKKMINLQIVGAFSPFYQKDFQYSILPGTSMEHDGSFTRSYSYIGFELNYILTNPSHMKKTRK